MTRYQRSERVFFSRMPDGQCAILDVERSIYFGLNGVAARVWELLAEPKNQEDLVRILTAEFAVSDDECRTQIAAFVDQMSAKALILSVP